MTELLYLLAAVAFIVGLKRLSGPRTARSGNMLAAAGMLLAIVVTLFAEDVVQWWQIAVGIAIGAGVGWVWARKVAMTDMPQMVAALNGFGGIASALVAGAELVAIGSGLGSAGLETTISIALSILIGALTFSGSFVAYAKLQGIMPGKPIVYGAQSVVNGALVVLSVAMAVWGVAAGAPIGFWILFLLSLVVGVTFVLPIGGADMPVVISLLNSFSGLAAAATGFVIFNSGLIIAGSLVGAAGFILTVQMCEAMNRPLSNVLFGAFGSVDAVAAAAEEGDKSVRRATPDDVAIALAYAQRVVIVPGYGLAVAQAQHDTRKLARELEERGVEVVYAIHPVAGRMPGHMNVLLAEADVPYEQLIDLDDANPNMSRTDVALILGANNVVNPAARDEAGSPIYGMPIIEADHAKTVVVVKRSLSPGFAGIDNPLFYKENTMMYFADAKKALQEMSQALTMV